MNLTSFLVLPPETFITTLYVIHFITVLWNLLPCVPIPENPHWCNKFMDENTWRSHQYPVLRIGSGRTWSFVLTWASGQETLAAPSAVRQQRSRGLRGRRLDWDGGGLVSAPGSHNGHWGNLRYLTSLLHALTFLSVKQESQHWPPLWSVEIHWCNYRCSRNLSTAETSSWFSWFLKDSF